MPAVAWRWYNTGIMLPWILSLATAGSFPVQSTVLPEHAFLQQMTGRWVMRGKIGKKETTHDVTAAWVLNKNYIQIHEISREKDDKGRPQYDAIVYVSWDPIKKQFACLWLDTTVTSSFTPIGIGQLSSDGKQVEFQFGDREDGIDTTFAFDAAKHAWAWNIDNLQRGKSLPFARLVLTKH